jgi:hypothetical protein
MHLPRDLEATFDGPPCESQIELDVEYRLRKYLAPGVRVERQAWVSTPWGAFRIDFVIHTRGQKVGIECDGAAFHDAWRDEWRDAVALGSGALDEMIRFAGQDLHHRPDDCIYLLSTMHPNIFTERAVNILDRIASEEAHRTQMFIREYVRYFATEGNGDDDQRKAKYVVQVPWRRRLAPHQYWQELYAAALKIGPCTLDELIERDKATWPSRTSSI